ncbi:hypothetical protein BC939DRAFT_439744 [Gamsiella multidivaricata]|uniref:uncharacterized protein n=1 Tax=Gamsiella multidivaricata TaxID=101098 RepID=UPI00221ED090|nr:uncharacterized protein BC939DRAFT_439744 [Gamsiella multidivaricata]KAG0357536.1 hypothetical protein BGZ54_000308 [Gamsiella multidivaricata]KAI7830170.1 hypothetical protein BC939DRAFT_439744 [Gamsiella multidivaricata]
MTTFRFWAACLVAVVVLIESTTAHMALLYPMPRGGIRDKKQYDAEVHAFVNFNKHRTMPCNGYNKMGPVTKLKAGQTLNVRFWGPALKGSNLDHLPAKPTGSKQINQARHGGGFCEFSLSYDGGKTFHKIGQYTKSCPDFYYEWPVKIPANVPSCNTPGKCLFVWSWTAVNVPQFYINCADVTIAGVKGGKLPSKSIQVVDIPNHKQKVTAQGDGYDEKMGKGPIKNEVNDNMSGKFQK